MRLISSHAVAFISQLSLVDKIDIVQTLALQEVILDSLAELTVSGGDEGARSIGHAASAQGLFKILLLH